MKTKNNVQKAVLRTAAVIVSFVLISFTVSAQDFWKRVITNSSFNEIAVAMIDVKKETNNSENSSTSRHSSVTSESALVLENWMLNENYFNFDVPSYYIETEIPMQLEQWMTNSENFEVANDQDEPLLVESWMTSKSYWND